MSNRIRQLGAWALLAFVALVSFTSVALAQGAVNPDDKSLLELLRPVYDAVTGKQYALAGALGLVAAVALVKRYLGNRIAWLHSDAGGATTTLLMAFGTAMATSLAPGAHLSWGMAKGALLVAFAAAGGYTMLKHLALPLLLRLAGKLPTWAQPLLRIVLWIFDKPVEAAREAAEKKAESAGDAAVAAGPPTGIDGIAGAPKDVP